MGKAKDMGVINQGKEKIGGKNVQKIMLNTKMNKHKKKPNKRITLMCAHKWKDDKQITQRGMMTKEQRNLKGMKGTDKMELLKLLVSFHSKLLKNGIMWDGVEGIHYIYLKHHPIRVDIPNDSNTMDHYLATAPNYHAELMRRQVKKGSKLLHKPKA